MPTERFACRSCSRLMPITRSLSGVTTGFPCSSKKRRLMSPTAPALRMVVSSSSEKIFPLLASKADGSNAPIPTSANEIQSNRATALRTKGSSKKIVRASGELITPGAGRKTASPCTNEERRCVSCVACTLAVGFPIPPRVCTTFTPEGRGKRCIAFTIASKVALHEEMPITSPGSRVDSSQKAAAAPIA